MKCKECSEKNINNSKERIDEICHLLEGLKKYTPCHGGLCVGYQNCEFGENGCYGESCAIDDVMAAIPCYVTDKTIIV